MLTRFLLSAAAVAMLASAAPARAQSAVEADRFAQAQARFDRELALYRQEFDRYRSVSGRASAYPAPRGPYRPAPDPRVADPRYDDDGYGDERDEGDYDPARYYRSSGSYQERTLRTDERVYAGEDGRYYCKRSDGTTGLIIGAAGGGILGNVIDGGRSRTVGTLLGGAVGALAGRSIDQNSSQVRCR